MPTISADSYEGKCDDPVLVSIVQKHHGWITKVWSAEHIFGILYPRICLNVIQINYKNVPAMQYIS